MKFKFVKVKATYNRCALLSIIEGKELQKNKQFDCYLEINDKVEK